MQSTIVNLASPMTRVASFEEAFGEFSELNGNNKKQSKRKKKLAQKLGKKDERVTQKEGKKFSRKKLKLEKRSLGNESEHEMDETTLSENDDAAYGNVGTGFDEGREEYENEQEAPQESATLNEYESEGEGSYEREAEEGDDSLGMEDEGDVIGEDDNYDEEAGFDGTMEEDSFSEFESKVPVKVSPEVQDIADKIEWHREAISRKRVQIAQNRARNIDSTEIMRDIDGRLQRIAELKSALKNYQDFTGPYSSADGNPNAKKKRAMEVLASLKAAKQKRMEIGRGPKKIKKTPVAASLKAEISKQKIVIPASEPNSEATGLIGIDDSADVGRAPVREITLNASGPASTINWKGVAIGTGLGLLAIWAIKKYNILK